MYVQLALVRNNSISVQQGSRAKDHFAVLRKGQLSRQTLIDN